jgi:hypothetical protein
VRSIGFSESAAACILGIKRMLTFLQTRKGSATVQTVALVGATVFSAIKKTSVPFSQICKKIFLTNYSLVVCN